MDVENLLTRAQDATTINQLSDFVADDVRAFVNGKLVADRKREWTRYWASSRASAGRVLAYSAG